MSKKTFVLNFDDTAIVVDDLKLTETVVAFNAYFINSSSFWSSKINNKTFVGFWFSALPSALNLSALQSLGASLREAARVNHTRPAVALPTDVNY
jgi:hypothetical protein